MEINRELAAKVLSVVDAGLVEGVGKPIAGQMCVEAAVCFAMGLPHGDEPTCVSPALRSLKISLNDSAWSSNSARAKGMRRLAIIQLGSKEVLNDIEFVKRIAEMTIRKQVPRALRLAASLHTDSNHRSALLLAADRCEKECASYAAHTARLPASAARYAAHTARYAASAARYAAHTARYAAHAARDAAHAARDAASAASDEVLAEFAEDVVQILIEMKVPGVDWLDLAPLESSML